MTPVFATVCTHSHGCSLAELYYTIYSCSTQNPTLLAVSDQPRPKSTVKILDGCHCFFLNICEFCMAYRSKDKSISIIHFDMSLFDNVLNTIKLDIYLLCSKISLGTFGFLKKTLVHT